MAAGKFLIALAVLLLGWAPPSSAQPARRLGDLDGDGLLTTLDYALLLDHINATNGNRTVPYPGSTNQLPSNLLGYADITGDGLLDTNDLHRLVDGILGLPLNPFPRPITFEPAHLVTNDAVPRLVVYFNEPINSNFITQATVTVVHLGRDRILGTVDDSNVLSGTLTYSSGSAALVLTFPTNLLAGLYQATVHTNITDLAGRMMTRSYSWQFATLGGVDSDHDGIPDFIEAQLSVYPGSPIKLDPHKASTLDDGILDGDRDADGDDLSNAEEIFRLTDPARWDSDNDGWADGVEVADGTDPCDRNSHPQWNVFARPPVEIAALDGETLGIGNFGTIVARPPVEINQPAEGESLGLSNLGVIVARPPVTIDRPGLDEVLGPGNFGTLVARPPVDINQPAKGEALGVGNVGLILAPPPITITNKPGFAPISK